MKRSPLPRYRYNNDYGGKMQPERWYFTHQAEKSMSRPIPTPLCWSKSSLVKVNSDLFSYADIWYGSAAVYLLSAVWILGRNVACHCGSNKKMCMGVRPLVTTAVHHSAAALKGSRKIKNGMKWCGLLIWFWQRTGIQMKLVCKQNMKYFSH